MGNMEQAFVCASRERGEKPKPDPVLALRLTLGELTRTIVDLEDTRDNLTERIEAIQERIISIRAALKEPTK